MEKQMLEELMETVRSTYPSAKVKMETYSSGNIWLDIDLSSVSVEMEYRPQQGFGVSLVDEQTLPFTPHDKVFTRWDEAREHILNLLKDNAP